MLEKRRRYYLRTMGIPEAFSGSLCFIFEIAFAGVLFCWIALELLDFGPAILEKLRGDVEAANFCGAKVARYVVVGGKGMGRDKSDFFSDCHCA